MLRGLTVPCFAAEPADLVSMGVEAERAGFDGFFVWDHLVYSDSGAGPPIVDPWQVLALVAAGTSRIRIGTMITPVSRRRPWKLAKETTTLDRLSGGRVILGVGLGSPAQGDFGIFGDPAGDRTRADLLDEGLDVLAGLWSGELFSYEGTHFTVGPVRFAPTPVQQPRIPIWVGGILPADKPVARAARWDGFSPIHYGRAHGRPTPEDIAAARARIEALRGSVEGFDIAVWAELDSGGEAAPASGEAGPLSGEDGPLSSEDGFPGGEPWAVAGARFGNATAELLTAYSEAGATWWLESVWAHPGWEEAVRARLARPG